jgi:hypothetical protein
MPVRWVRARSDPAPLADDAQQLVGHRQAEQLGIGQKWLAAATAPRAGLIDRAAAYAALWHYGARVGVEEPGGFLRQVMAAIAAADPPHRARLSRGFLGLVAAAQLDEAGPAGIDRLREIAGRALCRQLLGRDLTPSGGHAEPRLSLEEAR